MAISILNKVNQHISKAEFKQAHKALSKFIYRADRSKVRTDLRERVNNFKKNHKKEYKSNEPLVIEKMAFDLQDLAKNADQNLKKTKFSFGKFIIGGFKYSNLVQASFIFGIVTSFLGWHSTLPMYDKDGNYDKIKLAIYDFDNHTTHDEARIDDILNKAINIPHDNIWSKYFESKRISDCRTARISDLKSKSWDKTAPNSIRRFLKTSKADYGISGFVTENKTGFHLTLNAQKYDRDKNELVHLNTIKMDVEDLGDIIRDPCQRAGLLDLMKDFFSVKKYTAFVSETKELQTNCDSTSSKFFFEHISTLGNDIIKDTVVTNNLCKAYNELLESFKYGDDPEEFKLQMIQEFKNTHKDFVFAKCSLGTSKDTLPPTPSITNPSPNTKSKEALLKDVLKRMKEVLKNQNAIEVGLDNDVIYLTTFFPINSSKVPLSTQTYLADLENIIVEKLQPIRGQGHSCVLGEGSLKDFNARLSNDRISNLLSSFTFKDSLPPYKGLGPIEPLDALNHEKNRRATLRFLLKEEVPILSNKENSDNASLSLVGR